ncbi:MAG: NAD(P)H-dependent oxidoreductase [Desulfovibrio sp.]|nr:NAD(P)H-dependent oxidoreductase [Desulfovibrio sp.]
MDRRDFLQTAALTALAGVAAPLAGPGVAAAEPSEKKAMKILVLTGSPRKNGNSNHLASRFIEGAREAGHSVTRFDAGQSDVHPCIACNSCGMDGPCIFQDDFALVREHIVPADMVVFATPMYYFGISAQLKAVIDRFYAINGQIHVPKKAALLMTYANTAAEQAAPIAAHYDVLLDYLGWRDAGRVIAPGVWTEGSVATTPYPRPAYELGKSL